MSTSNRPLQSRRQAVQTGEDDYNSDDGAENIKATLETSLSEVKTAGSFATSGQCLNACFPGLCVEGVGLVGLPLTEHTAGAIIAICHQAPYGKGASLYGNILRVKSADERTGSETVVNESVRKTWELNPDRFEFLNPEWQPSMQKVASSAAQQLGLAEGVSVKAELYKLLLYEEVAMFKAHQE